VLDHPEYAAVFQERHVDFCCDGNATVAETCAARRLGQPNTHGALERARAAQEGPPREDPRTMATLDPLAHVVVRHHEFLRTLLPPLEPLAAKVAGVHGEHNPKLVELRDVFLDLREALEEHVDRALKGNGDYPLTSVK
jgi:regulator of cell morphogenesis and NO signaling